MVVVCGCCVLYCSWLVLFVMLCSLLLVVRVVGLLSCVAFRCIYSFVVLKNVLALFVVVVGRYCSLFVVD